jgi:hypothetical protein
MMRAEPFDKLRTAPVEARSACPSCSGQIPTGPLLNWLHSWLTGPARCQLSQVLNDETLADKD